MGGERDTTPAGLLEVSWELSPEGSLPSPRRHGNASQSLAYLHHPHPPRTLQAQRPPHTHTHTYGGWGGIWSAS